MSIATMGRKNEWSFAVHLMLSKLTSVASMNGTLYARVKLKSHRVGTTERREVTSFQVVWQQPFDFVCTMTANAQGVLNPCIVKVAIHKVHILLSPCLGIIALA